MDNLSFIFFSEEVFITDAWIQTHDGGISDRAANQPTTVSQPLPIPSTSKEPAILFFKLRLDFQSEQVIQMFPRNRYLN